MKNELLVNADGAADDKEPVVGLASPRTPRLHARATGNGQRTCVFSPLLPHNPNRWFLNWVLVYNAVTC